MAPRPRAATAALAVALLSQLSSAQSTLFQAAASQGLTTLDALLTSAGLAPTFNATSGTLTLFGPTNAAFAAIPPPLVAWLTNPRAINAAALSSTLAYHALGAVVNSTQISAAGTPLVSLCADCTPALTAYNDGTSVTIRNGATTIVATVTPANILAR